MTKLPIWESAADKSKIRSTIAVIRSALNINLSGANEVIMAAANPIANKGALGFTLFSSRVVKINNALTITLEFFLPIKCGSPFIPEVRS